MVFKATILRCCQFRYWIFLVADVLFFHLVPRGDGDFIIGEEDDGIVPLSSAAPQQFENISVTNNCYTNLFEISEEYEIVKERLLSWSNKI